MTEAEQLFPLKEMRPLQQKVIQEIEKAFAKGNRFVILEAPVGSGKSPIAITFARLFQNSHIITPRKSLQNQYFSDFDEHVVLMKGRKAYPCTNQLPDKVYKQVIKEIESGKIQDPQKGEPNCSDAPCIGNRTVYLDCTDTIQGIAGKPCPYHKAIDVAQNNPHVIHNLHSFIFQTSFFIPKFFQRKIMIVDECHEIEGIIRDFVSKKMTLPGAIDVPSGFKLIIEWTAWLKQQVSRFDNKHPDRFGKTDQEKFLERVELLEQYKDTYNNNFVVEVDKNVVMKTTRLRFVPSSIGNNAHKYIFDYGEKVLLMSGTIYSKALFCQRLGINQQDATFLRIDSSFPVESRPIYMKKEYSVDTSHAKWQENFPKIISVIKEVMGKFPDVKGLIQVPSYVLGHAITQAIADKRIMTHDKDNFLSKLEKFYAVPGNKVFVSPVCQQGVDFKDDRARFQIIIRVPYPNTNDVFVAHKLKTDFPWYNYQALVTFGQQIGRVNRSETDFGATILLDERFEKFIAKNKIIPKWIIKAIKR